MTSRPRSRSPTISSVTRVAFSVEPSTSDNGCLIPSMSMPEGDHAGVLAEVHPVDHQRHQVQPGQVRGQQLGQRGLGRRDEPPRHRRARRGRRGLLGAGADRLQPDRVAAGRQPGQHPLQRHPPQHLGVGEQLVGRPPAAPRSRRPRASAAARPAPGARPGSPTRRRGRAGSRSARGRGGPWARTPRSRRASMIAAITCSPVPTARASSPSRSSPASSASATLTVSGTAGWLVSISWFW